MRARVISFGMTLVGAAISFFPVASVSQPYHHKHRHANRHHLARTLTTTTTDVAYSSISVPSGNYGNFLPGTATPCAGTVCATPSTLSLAPSIVCPADNNTAYNAGPASDNYTIICDVDFPGQNIYPFVLAASFQVCMDHCSTINTGQKTGGVRCAGFVFAPGRAAFADDCYLKSSLDNPFTATMALVGAIVSTGTISTATGSSSVLQPIPTTATSPTTLASTTHNTIATPQPSGWKKQIIVPKVSGGQLHGASINQPARQWLYHEPATPEKLASNLLVPGFNADLTSDYPIAGDTGSLTAATSPVKDVLSDLSVIPHLSRDGGKGGEINGQHLFIFCDTAGFTTTTDTKRGDMVSFVSSSAALDSGMNALYGKPLTLVDGIGEWQDDVGRLRGFAPMTFGEEAYNIALSGNGHRYAVWPESSLIPFNKTHSIQYASLVYDEVDMASQAANFTTIGNTLLTVSVDGKYGPVAERTVKRLFNWGEVMWGSLGGIRSWGHGGIGSTDGSVYVFGQGKDGVLLARTSTSGIADRASYEYWTGESWSSSMLPPTAISYMINSSVMDFDMFYSPHHATFVMVYLTPYADNTFYWRYLRADHAILPPYAGGDSNADYVENIVKYNWSEEKVLYQAATPAAGGYIYGGGVHAGYFGDEDVTKGGTRILLSWTEHTGKDAATPETGYAHMTAAVTLGS